MSVYVIGDPVTIEAFGLIGVSGRTPAAGEAIDELVADVARQEGANLVLIQSEFTAGLSEERIDEIARTLQCLVTQLPGIGGPEPDPTNFLRLVRRSVGGSG